MSDASIQLEELMNKITSLEEKLSQVNYVEQVASAVKTTDKGQEEDRTEAPKAQSGVNPDEVATLIKEAIKEAEQERRQLEAQIARENKLKSILGDNYQERLEKIAESVHVPAQTLEEMAINNEKLFMSVALQTGESFVPNTSVNTTPSTEEPTQDEGFLSEMEKVAYNYSFFGNIENVKRFYEAFDKGLREKLGKPKDTAQRIFPDDFEAFA